MEDKMNILHFPKVSTLTKQLLLIFVVSFMFGSSIATAKSTKPAFTERFEKKRAKKHRGNNVITVKEGVVYESKKPAVAERFEMKWAKKYKGGNVITVKQGSRETTTLKDHYDKKRAKKHKGGNVITVKPKVN